MLFSHGHLIRPAFSNGYIIQHSLDAAPNSTGENQMEGGENYTFGDLLRGFREREDLTQGQLAVKLGMQTPNSIGAWSVASIFPKLPAGCMN